MNAIDTTCVEVETKDDKKPIYKNKYVLGAGAFVAAVAIATVAVLVKSSDESTNEEN